MARRAELDQAFSAAVALLPPDQSFASVNVPVNVPSMARRIVGDLLGWPLHLRNKGPADEQDLATMGTYGVQLVTPIMRHKPVGVSLLDPRKRPPRPSRQRPPEEPSAPQPAPAALEERLGAAVRKEYDGSVYTGSVAKVDDFNGEKFYLVIYDDGNQEHMTADDLAKYLLAYFYFFN